MIKKIILLNLFFLNLFNNNLGIPENKAKNVKWVNVLMHGTFGLRAYLSIGTFFSLWQDKIDLSDYHIGVQAMRGHRGFYTLQPIQELGLQEITSKNLGPYAYMKVSEKLKEKCNIKESQELYYTYGWSGLVSHKKRLDEAYILYQDLKYEYCCLLKKYNCCEIKFRLIAYSHGGNIALQLGNVYTDKSVKKEDFFIDELIIIGTPLHNCNKCLIVSDIFKKVYNIYSRSDCIQHLDIFSPFAFFSHRYFNNTTDKIFNNKIQQIEIQVAKSRPTDKSICYKSTYGCCAMHNPLNYSPGHCELWFFGWTHRYYRKKFPLYPLPVSVFLPYILSSISKYSPDSSFIKFRIFPDREISSIKINSKKIIEFPFLNNQELKDLQNYALSLCPNFDFCQLTEYKCRPKINRFKCNLHHMHIKCSMPPTDRFCSSVEPLS